MKNIFKIFLLFSIVLASNMFANNLIVNYDNKSAVNNWPNTQSLFTLNKSTNISSIQTYHWNNAQGSIGNKYGAYIKLINLHTNKIYGPWRATLKSGMNGAKNVYWIVYPNITLSAGKYLVLDSDSATWSHNAGTKGIGFTRIFSTTNKTSLPNKPNNTNAPQNTNNIAANYKLTKNAAISGHNNKQLQNVSVVNCMTSCEDEDWCKSFDYHKLSNKCDLSSVNVNDVGKLKTNYKNNPYDHYSHIRR
ncbi:MAG: hypothetical protein ACI9TV_000345 [Sulfurimonas sp.]|jgi:hypothetical protein|uniref:PAN domain-containing protein n=1 Tax=Sulfurimonas sp. TaxID=2022749 RepID=UPI0039E635E7